MLGTVLLAAVIHSPCLDFARTEFAKHLPGTGIALELKVDESLGEDAFRVCERGGALEVTGGNERGCLYGVYSFLENECGARFYTSWCSKPAVPPVAVSQGLDRTERPAFEARMPYWWDVIYHPEFAAKLRVNANPFNPMPDSVGGNACRFGKGMPSCHTLGSLLPDAHNLCLTDATNLAVVTERVLARIAADPDARFYGISYDDNLVWCRCPRCEAINREEGTPAGTLVRFVNAVADVVAEKFPKATLETLAYQHTVVPPKKTRLRKNVIVCLCSNKCEFTYPFEESPFEENREFVQAMRDWGRMSPLYVWDYTTCFCGYPKPFPNGAVLLKNIRFFRDHGVRYLFEQGDYQGVHADFGEWKAYLEAKAMWNPDLDEEALRKDFFAGYYGAGAPFVDTYYRKAISAHRAETDRTKHKMIFGSEKPLPFCTPAFIAEGRALWAQADAATRADRLANYNVRMGAMSLDFQELLMEFAKPAQDLVRQRELAARIRACIVEARPKTLTLLEFPQALLGRINALMDKTEDVTGVEAKISAQWICAERDDRRFVRFKNVFESDGSTLRLHVAADDASVLYIDARRIGRGDAAGGGKSYRSYDLSLTPGRHKLEAVVFVGSGSQKPPTLLVQAEGGHYGPQLTTGIGKWRARTFDNVEFREESVFIDGDSPWDDFWDAFVRGTKVAHGEDVRSLRPSRRPPEKGESRQSLYVKTPLEIPAKTTKRILWDLGEERCAYPEMAVAPGTGAGLRFRWEWLDDPSSEKATIADESQHRGGAGGEGFTTPWPRRGRACRLTFTTGDKPATVSRIAVVDERVSGLEVTLDGRPAEWPVLKTYEGECLRRIKMPLGGIGTGTFSLAGNGGLVDWAIFNTPAIGNTPTANDVASGFLIRTEDADGKVSARLLEGPIDTSLYDGGEGCRIPNHAFPRFRECTFKVAYPLAQVELKDDSMPVAARLEAMNPLVTNNAAASGIPAVLLRWNVRNVTAKPLKVSVMGMLVNPTGGGSFEDKDDKQIDIVGTASGGLTGVGVLNGAPDACDNTHGSVVMAVPEAAGVVSRATRIADSGWMVRFDRYWKQFLATGRADDFSDPDAGRWRLQMGTVAVQVELAPNEEKAIPFIVAWRYPHRPCWSGQGYRDTPVRGAFDPKRDVGNFYATRYPLAIAAAVALWKGLPDMEAKTVGFVNGVLAAKAPEVVKEAALFNLSTLRTETCWRSADGHFYGWEGIFETGGSCFGSCTHVWGYEHALIDLWPELARDMTELQFERQMGDDGHIAFRIQLPLAAGKASDHMAAADGQMQCIIKAYENWKKGGGDAWLERLWPKIRKAVEFCWVPGGWDADVDGVMEGCQHNTMDVEYYGPNPQMEFLYLAALKAAAAMADARGDAAFAKKCRGLYVIGSAWTESNLFNGEWYEHKVVPPKGTLAKWVSGGAARDLKDPDYQLAKGCLVDQLLGDYASRHVGLGAVADEKNADRTLDTILTKNASANVGSAYNCGRDYALPGEPALKMAWYPEGTMPKKPFPYYGENMTGFEYVVAANLAQRGRFAEAEKVVRDIRNRYDGRKRNPFDEAECGHHYSRALDAWSVLQAWK